MKTPKGKQIDHKNRNGLDNRRENLCIVSPYQNRLNLSNFRNNTSGVRGISWYENLKKWGIHVRRKGKLNYFGVFSDKKEAETRLLLIRQQLYGA
jgi:hypothetical protein